MPIAPGSPGKRVAPDGRTRFYFLENVDGELPVDNVPAITISELADFNDLSTYTPKGGWSGSPSFAKVSGGDVTTRFTGKSQGTWEFDPTWQLYLQNPDNEAFELFAPHGKTGLLLHFWGLTIGTAPAAGAAYYAFHVETTTPVPIPATENENEKFSLDPAILEEPVYDGTLVAGGGGG